MSKSKGNVLYADELVDFFGVDAVRYFVLHEMPFENDGVITWELMVERLNSELANTLGNLVNRTISMSNKYFGGVVENKGVTEPVDEDMKSFVLGIPAKVSAKMDKLRVADAMTEVFSLFKRLNKYIDETMPWALAKEEDKKDRLATVLYNLIEGITIGAALLEAFMPETTDRILAQLNAEKRDLESLKTFGLYPSGNKVVAQAVVVTMFGPLAPVKMDICPGPMLEMSMGIMNGEILLGPASSSLLCQVSSVCRPPSPIPRMTATSSALSGVMANPASSSSILAAATANWVKRSMRRACLAGIQASGANPLTSPAMREV